MREQELVSKPEQYLDAVILKRYLSTSKKASEMRDWDEEILEDALYYTNLVYHPNPHDSQDDREDWWKQEKK